MRVGGESYFVGAIQPEQKTLRNVFESLQRCQISAVSLRMVAVN